MPPFTTEVKRPDQIYGFTSGLRFFDNPGANKERFRCSLALLFTFGKPNLFGHGFHGLGDLQPRLASFTQLIKHGHCLITPWGDGVLPSISHSLL